MPAAPVVAVPVNTMLSELDESLRGLLRRDLGRHGFDGVNVAFDAPDREWSAQLSTPTVNAFLYDVQQSTDHRPVEWDRSRRDGRQVEMRPPLRVEAAYAVTAWARAVEDEHRLLSQVLAVLYAYPELPREVLAGALGDDEAQPFPLRTKVAQKRRDGAADFWTAIGGRYKASVDLVVTLSCTPGVLVERGPDVRTQAVRVAGNGRPPGLEERVRIGGSVRDERGEPVADAWVLVTAPVARAATTGPDGRFLLGPLAPGAHACRVRAADGREHEQAFRVPGPPLDLTLGAARTTRRR